jgi:UDP-GlcNAc:undecaprenyl-phosphate/decaprenyl-phosphate GlcNAc-1-phosphate transferase
MSLLASILLVAFTASLVLTAAVRSIARRFGVVDRPDGKRKLHGRPVPLLGGVAVCSAAMLGLLAVYFNGDATPKFSQLSTAWMIAAAFVCFVGGVDDYLNLPSRVKLGLQVLSVLPIILLGYHVDRIVAFGHPIDLGWLGIPLTVLWLVGCINALNLIDGMDGLASIIGLSTAAMLGVIAASQGQMHVTWMAAALAAAVAGFMLYNLPPASIFLGDSGSMVIGLTLGVLGMQGSLKTSATLAITAPVVVMTVPMFDIVAAIVRRRLTGRSFDSPDRLHIHHRLLDRGWTPWQVLCLIGAICLTMGAAATAATIFRRDALAWIASMSLVVLLIRLRLFGHEEFALAKDAVVRALRSVGFGGTAQGSGGRGEWRVASGEPLAMQIPKPPIPRSSPLTWDAFLRQIRAWNVSRAEFCSSADGETRRIRWVHPTLDEGACRWSLVVSLPGEDESLCELRISGPQPQIVQRDSAALTSLLKSYGEYFSSHEEQFFGALRVDAEQTSDTRPRKAA